MKNLPLSLELNPWRKGHDFPKNYTPQCLIQVQDIKTKDVFMVFGEFIPEIIKSGNKSLIFHRWRTLDGEIFCLQDITYKVLAWTTFK